MNDTPASITPGTGLPAIDAGAFRRALGHFASGVTVITGMAPDGPAGFTCQSFYSVSLDPPLISFSVRRASSTWPRLRPGGRFAVNVLAEHQAALSDAFARSSGDRWSGVAWQAGAEGNPILTGALIGIDCRIHAEIEAGDHWIVLGRVMHLHVAETTPGGPLVYYQGRYRTLSA